MSLEAITWAYKTEVGSPTRKAVLLVLANYADEDDSAYPGKQRICSMTELKMTAVKTSLRELQDMGVITEVETRYRHDGSNTTNRYFLNLGWKQGGSPGDPSPGSGDDPPRSGDAPRTNTKSTRKGGTANPKPAPPARVSGKTFGAQPEKEPEDQERVGSLQDDGPKEPEPRKTPKNTVDLASDFQRSARLHYPKGDTRRLVNLKALRSNIARWRSQDGIQVHEISNAMDVFWAGVDGYVKADGEPWRRFINVYARVHAKASAPDITDPAYYTDQQQEENDMDAAEKWLKEQGL